MLLFIRACSYPLKVRGQCKELDFYHFIESLKSAKKNSSTLTTKTHGKCLNFHANECLTSDFALQLNVFLLALLSRIKILNDDNSLS